MFVRNHFRSSRPSLAAEPLAENELQPLSMPCAQWNCNAWVEGWRHYRGGPDRQIFLCEQCLSDGWGRQLPDEDTQVTLRSMLDSSRSHHQSADVAAIHELLHAYDLLGALDANVGLLKKDEYDMAVCHAILLLMDTNQIREGLRRGVEAEFQHYERIGLERLRRNDPVLDQAFLNFQSAIEAEFLHHEWD